MTATPTAIPETWEDACALWLDWLIFPRTFDTMTKRGAVSALRERMDVIWHEFTPFHLGEWGTPTKSPMYLFKPMARLAFPMGARAAGRSHDAWRDTIQHEVVRKHKNYGQGNIIRGGWVLLVGRTSDKVERLDTLTGGAFNQADLVEPIADAWMDLVGYSIIACMAAADHFTLPLSPSA